MASVAVCLMVGRYPISPGELWNILVARWFHPSVGYEPGAVGILYSVRVPRMLAAVLVGAVLSLAGATYQGIFRNPLVSPDVLGVSQGASVGAASAILLGFAGPGVALFALVGGLAAVIAATSIPRLLRNDSTLMLVLSGVIVGGFATAAVGLLKFVADPETQLAAITFWQLGSLSDVRTAGLARSALLAVPAAAVLLLMRWRVNVISLGDVEAKALGVDLRRDRGVTILLATVLTAAAVSLAGTVGWVGLVVPHLARLVVGADNSRLMPLSVTLGASFLVIVDTVARSLSEAEVPLSVVTGFIGAPLFLLLLGIGRVKVR